MFGALIRAAERWRSVKITEFERRQLAAVRQELNQEYEAIIGLHPEPSKYETKVRKSSNSRTRPCCVVYPPIYSLVIDLRLIMRARVAVSGVLADAAVVAPTVAS